MSYNLPFPVNYAVFYTGYTTRLIDLKNKLLEKCYDLDVKPLYVYEPMHLQNNFIYLIGEPSEKKSQKMESLRKTAAKAAANEKPISYQNASIAFKINELSDIFYIYDVLKELEYCNLCDIVNIQYTEQDNKKIVTVYVDSESG